MASVFISYRRSDAPAHAGRLYDHLAARFGEANVFKDLDSMEPGADFVETIEDAIGRCDALVVVIGSGWDSSRLDDPRDWVRLEIANALERGIRVVPVLVQGASIPLAADLPEDVRPLRRRHAVELSEGAWTVQVKALVGSLERSVKSSGTDVSDLDVGRSLVERGDLDGARQVFRRVIESGDTARGLEAQLELGHLFRWADKDFEAAHTAYRRVIESGDGDVVHEARLALGRLCRSEKDLQGARDAYQSVIDSGSEKFATRAWLGLGMTLERQGDTDAACDAYNRVVAGADKHAPVALLFLGGLLRKRGDVDGARGAYRRAMATGDPNVISDAGADLAEMLAADDDLDGARDAFRRALQSGDPTRESEVAYRFGGVLAHGGDSKGARTAYQRAVDAGDRPWAEMAADEMRRSRRWALGRR
jgi:tetratricopeptide (TPR) repeat protein